MDALSLDRLVTAVVVEGFLFFFFFYLLVLFLSKRSFVLLCFSVQHAKLWCILEVCAL